jgi:hypothetical protein
MGLCSEKNSELPAAMRRYKGRLVLRGDQVKDEDGFYAVFSEQETSASNMATRRFMDALARVPGNDGENSDAAGAYTQVVLKDWMLKGETVVETYISLLRNRRPKEWDDIEDPVCLLRLNLYGHPLAGLYWERFCTHNLMSVGFEKVQGWECLFVHREKQLFMSVYVDDFKMADNKNNMAGMWKEIPKDDGFGTTGTVQQ